MKDTGRYGVMSTIAEHYRKSIIGKKIVNIEGWGQNVIEKIHLEDGTVIEMFGGMCNEAYIDKVYNGNLYQTEKD